MSRGYLRNTGKIDSDPVLPIVVPTGVEQTSSLSGAQAFEWIGREGSRQLLHPVTGLKTVTPRECKVLRFLTLILWKWD